MAQGGCAGEPDTRDENGGSVAGKVGTLWRASKADFSTAGIGQKLGLLAMLGFIFYEWGPGNEIAAPLVGAQALAHTTGAAAVLVTSLAAGGFTLVEQLASGWTAAYTGSRFPRLNRAAFELTQDTSGAARYGGWSEIPFGKRFAYSFYLGSSAAVIREGAVTGATSFRALRAPALGSALISSGAVAILGAVAGGIKWACEGTAAAPYADRFVAVLGNPITWIALLLVVVLVNRMRRRASRAQSAK